MSGFVLCGKQLVLASSHHQDPCHYFISDSGKLLTWKKLISEQHKGALKYGVLPAKRSESLGPCLSEGSPYAHCSGERLGQALPEG